MYLIFFCTAERGVTPDYYPDRRVNNRLNVMPQIEQVSNQLYEHRFEITRPAKNINNYGYWEGY